MLIDPVLQAKLYLYSLLSGVALGALYDAMLLLQVLVGAYPKSEQIKALYAVRLPLLSRSVGLATNRVHHTWQRLSCACRQLIFPIVYAGVLLLLCFGYNRGAFRLPVFLLSLLGFAFWRCVASKHTARVFDLLAYALAALFLYLQALLLLPLRLALRFLCSLFLRPLYAFFTAIYQKWLFYTSCRRCRAQLMAAASGSLTIKRSIFKKKRNLNHGI